MLPPDGASHIFTTNVKNASPSVGEKSVNDTTVNVGDPFNEYLVGPAGGENVPVPKSGSWGVTLSICIQ